MKTINVIGFAILIKKVMHVIFISIWYGFSKLIDSTTALLADALTALINE
jgi:hypothetical protein